MKILEINNLVKRFDDTEILKGISLTVNEGEVVSIIGPSGSGKSTLLRCAAMLETVTSGDISYCGEAAVKTNENKVIYAPKNKMKSIKGNFSFVFQNFNLFPHFSVMKNVTDAPICVQKRDSAEVNHEAEEILKNVGLLEYKDHYPCQLSGGQQQRVAIARALAMKPKILFFDEPTSALDPELTADVLKIMQQLAESKMTMLVVTHEIEFARRVSDRVIFIDKGVIVEQGTPAEVIENPSHQRTKEFLSRISK